MRELADNLYMFSLSARSYGKVVAQRACDHCGAVGRDIFEYLGIDDAEQSFLDGTDLIGLDCPIVLVGRRGEEKRAVLFDISSSRELAVGIAMELIYPARALADVYRQRPGALSPRAQEMVGFCDNVAYEVEREMSASRSIACLFELGRERLEVKGVINRFSSLFSSVSELVCIPVECSYQLDETYCDGGEALMHINACLYIILALAMAAREYSKDRRLCALVTLYSGFVSVSLGFENREKAWHGEALMRDLIADGDMICEISARDGKTICSMAPCYADEGLLGVKERMDAFRMLEFWK